MAFDLSKAAGLNEIMSKLDTREITMVPLDQIDRNEKNFFVVNDVQDLMESIQINGILQPLLLVRSGERYRIIAGHRRYKAACLAGLKEVPAIILPEMRESMEWFMLIKTNTTTRELSHAEKAEAAIRLKKHLVQMKQEGVKIPGKLRDIVAEQMEISRTELARMEVIEKNLIPAFKHQWKQNAMNASCAYELARLPEEDQEALLAEMDLKGTPQMTVGIVEHYKFMKKVAPWVNDDCPHPLGRSSSEQARREEKVFCTHAEKILALKEKGHPERCPGCCAKCGRLAVCYDACDNARSAAARNARTEQEAQNKMAAEISRATKEVEAQSILDNSRLRHIGEAVIPLVEKGGIQMSDIAKWWTGHHEKMCPDYDLDDYSEEDVACMLHPKCIEDADFSLTSFIAFCDAVDRTPNALLGYDDATAVAGWHPYPETRPNENQRVVVRRTVGTIIRCGEYLFRDGEWYEPGLDDYKMNITGVTHWIEAPDCGENV